MNQTQFDQAMQRWIEVSKKGYSKIQCSFCDSYHCKECPAHPLCNEYIHTSTEDFKTFALKVIKWLQEFGTKEGFIKSEVR